MRRIASSGDWTANAIARLQRDGARRWFIAAALMVVAMLAFLFAPWAACGLEDSDIEVEEEGNALDPNAAGEG